MARTVVVWEPGVEVLGLVGRETDAATIEHSLMVDRAGPVILAGCKTGIDRRGNERPLAETLAATSILRDKLSCWNRLFADDRS